MEVIVNRKNRHLLYCNEDLRLKIAFREQNKGHIAKIKTISEHSLTNQ